MMLTLICKLDFLLIQRLACRSYKHYVDCCMESKINVRNHPMHTMLGDEKCSTPIAARQGESLAAGAKLAGY
jgi:hypothetical protein